MTQPILNDVKLFKGVKNDEDSKQVGFEYFFHCKNWRYPTTGILGMDTILAPAQINQIGSSQIDGLFEYRFLNASNMLEIQEIAVTNGYIYKDVLGTDVPVDASMTQMSTGLVSIVIFNDRLYIATGRDYVKVYDGNLGIVSEMGAPLAEPQSAVGFLNGTYSYKMTLTTAGGEEVLGSTSNTVSVVNHKILLHLPIGYTGTTERNIYRTEAGGTSYKLLTTVVNNTDLTYLDNTPDASLTTGIPSVGDNELPKPYFLAVANQKLFGTVVTKYPTQVFITTTNNDIFDVLEGLDVANYGTDNTPTVGMGVDFNKVVVGTQKNIVFINPADNSVVFTRSNVGMKNGYTLQSIPAGGQVSGGLMFVSSLNDVRMMSGLQALPVSTSIDNVSTMNYAQNIRGELERALLNTSAMYSAFLDYRYYLVISGIKYVFDIRTSGWTTEEVKTASYMSNPTVLGIFGKKLYNGQIDGWIEQEYINVEYRGEDLSATIESPHISVSNFYKYLDKFRMWFIPSKNNSLSIKVIVDDDFEYPLESTFKVSGGVYNRTYFNKNWFEVDIMGLDFRVFNIQKPARWVKYWLTKNSGATSYQGFGFVGQALSNKEQ